MAKRKRGAHRALLGKAEVKASRIAHNERTASGHVPLPPAPSIVTIITSTWKPDGRNAAGQRVGTVVIRTQDERSGTIRAKRLMHVVVAYALFAQYEHGSELWPIHAAAAVGGGDTHSKINLMRRDRRKLVVHYMPNRAADTSFYPMSI